MIKLNDSEVLKACEIRAESRKIGSKAGNGSTVVLLRWWSSSRSSRRGGRCRAGSVIVKWGRFRVDFVFSFQIVKPIVSVMHTCSITVRQGKVMIGYEVNKRLKFCRS
jgi:hypothetical protein